MGSLGFVRVVFVHAIVCSAIRSVTLARASWFLYVSPFLCRILARLVRLLVPG